MREMKFETKTFELRHPTMIMWLVIMASLTTMGIVLFANLRPDNIELTVMLATPLTLALPLTLTFLLTSKVQFDSSVINILDKGINVRKHKIIWRFRAEQIFMLACGR
jgi:hypothetical protein